MATGRAPCPRFAQGFRHHGQMRDVVLPSIWDVAFNGESYARYEAGYWPPVNALASSATPCRNNWRICPLERKSRRISARRLVRKSPMT